MMRVTRAEFNALLFIAGLVFGGLTGYGSNGDSSYAKIDAARELESCRSEMAWWVDRARTNDTFAWQDIDIAGQYQSIAWALAANSSLAPTTKGTQP